MTRRAGPIDHRFPLEWERLLWSGAPTWRRTWRHPGERYHFTDFRAVVRRGGQTVQEMAFCDVARVEWQASEGRGRAGTGAVILHATADTVAPLVFQHLRSGEAIACILRILAAAPDGRAMDGSAVDAAAIQALVRRQGPAPDTPRWWPAPAITALTLVFTLGVVVVARHEAAPSAPFRTDALYLEGVKRPRREIAAFMQQTILPAARDLLGPIVGGADRVTCRTCHGDDADARQWAMPAVAALPDPELRAAGLERHQSQVDAQMRNAIYGYLAEHDNQQRAGYMRDVVMPRMAALLGRPPYDFTQPYAYNLTRNALGCYHCHQVTAPDKPSAAPDERSNEPPATSLASVP